MEQRKFLDQKGVEYLWSQLSLEDYPNNTLLTTVINAIDETKADRNEIPTTPEAVGADAAGTAASIVSEHDASGSAHSDIREKLLPTTTEAHQQLVTDSRGNTFWEDRSNGYFNYVWKVWSEFGWSSRESVEDNTFTYTYSGEPVRRGDGENPEPVPNAAGEKYEVIVDGVSYFATSEMICDVVEYEPTGLYGVGNIALYHGPEEAEDNGMPFFFYQKYEGDTGYMMYIFRSAGTYEVAIKKRYISETVSIDNRLLPAGIVIEGQNTGTTHQQLVTDGDGNVGWADRLAYDGGDVEFALVEDGNYTFAHNYDVNNMLYRYKHIFELSEAIVEGREYSVTFQPGGAPVKEFIVIATADGLGESWLAEDGYNDRDDIYGYMEDKFFIPAGSTSAKMYILVSQTISSGHSSYDIRVKISRTHREIHPLDPKFLPAGTVIEGQNVGSAYQQLVTDANSNAMWDDRTHYTNLTETPFIDIENMSEYDDGTMSYVVPGDYISDLQDGRLVRVHCVGSSFGEMTVDVSCQNGVGIYVDDDATNLHFNIRVAIPGSWGISYNEDSAKIDGALKVSYLTEIVVQLDEKFIPDTIARATDLVAITTAISGKVDAEVGMGLSANSYTDEEKTKVASIDSLIQTASDAMKAYTDTEVAALVNSAPETLDTLGELAAAFEENQEVVEALDASITNKQNKISDTLILVDTITGSQYKIQIQNGQLVSFPVE